MALDSADSGVGPARLLGAVGARLIQVFAPLLGNLLMAEVWILLDIHLREELTRLPELRRIVGREAVLGELYRCVCLIVEPSTSLMPRDGQHSCAVLDADHQVIDRTRLGLCIIKGRQVRCSFEVLVNLVNLLRLLLLFLLLVGVFMECFNVDLRLAVALLILRSDRGLSASRGTFFAHMQDDILGIDSGIIPSFLVRIRL